MKTTFWIVISPFSRDGGFPLPHTISDKRNSAISKVSREDWWGNKWGEEEHKEHRDWIWKHLYRLGFRVKKFSLSWNGGDIGNFYYDDGYEVGLDY